ncbi:Swc5p PWA37_004984 [Arxiozyma heterogenica]|uniref:SWR1-complex protein 5 n=1 Tax=Arxiozyma heterogenica TaxID=278026 RepID=A0AAN8A764_9SACH|nr:hypothetical protein RI543_005010 [Kazachstania heterogenica]
MDEKLTINNSVHENNENEEYNEEEDEDFVPDKEFKTISYGHEEEEVDDDKGEDSDDGESIKSRNYSKIESEVGGLIKTRRGHQLERERMAKHKYDNIMVSSDLHLSDKIIDIWSEMQNESTKRLIDSKMARQSVISVEPLHEDTTEMGVLGLVKEKEGEILIERSYKFAGEIIHEKKWVLKSSAEAKEYLNSLKFNHNVKDVVSGSTIGRSTIENDETDGNSNNDKKDSEKDEIIKHKEFQDDNGDGDGDNKPKLRRPLKRPPILEDIISGALKPKLSTLEKSKLDWVQYVDREGIEDELQYNKRSGYLAKQDFLSRVESRQDAQYKEFRRKQLALKFQTTQH